MDAPSIKELMATFIARDIADGEEVFVGTNLPVIRAGALLAHLHHGPSMRVMVAHTRTNLYHTPVMEYFELLTDWRGARWAEAYFNDNEIVMYQKSRRDSVFFVGALQIDAFGNSNLIGLGRDPRRLTLRGPGAIATTSSRVILWSRFFGSRILVRSIASAASKVSTRSTVCAELAACCGVWPASVNTCVTYSTRCFRISTLSASSLM